MSKTPKRVLGILYAFALTGLNASVIAFYALWQIADTAAINRMETGSGMDVAQMLPNSNLMWIAAHGSLLMLIIVDILALFLFAVAFSSRDNIPYIKGSRSATAQTRA